MSTEQTKYALEPKRTSDIGRVTAKDAPLSKAGVEPPTEATFVLDAVRGEDVGREFTANVDEKGRFYIPSGLRDRYEIDPDDWVDISVVAK